eukprot:m.143148 g.143148  ORF g.143148 m.143148 type:complete len:245 (+) comp14083_c1_seq1:60-794(+)
MGDFELDQEDEIESLLSIFPDELRVIKEDFPKQFELHVSSDESPDPDDAQVVSKLVLLVTYVENYPEEAPVVEIHNCEAVDDSVLEKLTEAVQNEVEDNLGMPSVFPIHSAVKELLDKENLELRLRIVREREAAQAEAERLHMERLTAGTAVTRESFLEWQTNFIAEMKELERAEGPAKRSTSGKTGKEMFESKMPETDAATEEQFMAQDDEIVDAGVFESLDLGGLEDLDDLDDEDSDESDED